VSSSICEPKWRPAVGRIGFVTIANNQPRQAQNFKVPHWYDAKFPTNRFHLSRKGKVLRVKIDGESATAATLDEVVEYDTVRLSLTPGAARRKLLKGQKEVGIPARLYSLKVGTPAR
jgi:hypothetical protein